MSEIEVKNAEAPPQALAREINEEHRWCEVAFETGLQHALRAGELLVQAKTLCKHGEWGRWLEENFEGSERTAQAYMKVFRERARIEEANPQRVADLSYREALKELAAPEEEVALGLWFECASFEEFENACEQFRRGEARAANLWSTGHWKHFSGLDRRARAGWFREVAIHDLAVNRIRGNTELAEHWRKQLFVLESIARPVDVPPSRERFGLERQLTYREMHVSILELDVILAERRLAIELKEAMGDHGGKGDLELAKKRLEEARATVLAGGAV